MLGHVVAWNEKKYLTGAWVAVAGAVAAGVAAVPLLAVVSAAAVVAAVAAVVAGGAAPAHCCCRAAKAVARTSSTPAASMHSTMLPRLLSQSTGHAALVLSWICESQLPQLASIALCVSPKRRWHTVAGVAGAVEVGGHVVAAPAILL